jgi:peptidoglycan/xylan/chitin deacetylase (PgdA/CDA1 family)
MIKRIVIAIIAVPLIFLCFNLAYHSKSVSKEISLAQFELYQGGIVRKKTKDKVLSLVFAAHSLGQGTKIILDTLKKKNIQAGFFLTGSFLTNPAFKNDILRIIHDGHYLGPHSYAHLYYNHWGEARVLVTEMEFKNDLGKNLEALERFGLKRNLIKLFLPPFETYNRKIVNWSKSLGLTVFSFTPGTFTYKDWAPKNHRFYANSQNILDNVLAKGRSDLQGSILLLHLGISEGRPDPFYFKLDLLLENLQKLGYSFQRIDRFIN